MSTTRFPLGYFGVNPDGNNEAPFNAQYNSFVQAMGGAHPSFFDTFVDFGVDPSQWGANASWTAWSYAQTGNQALAPGSGATPVVGLPLASNTGGWSNVDNFYKGIISGQYDSDYKAIVDAWAGQGYKSVDFRIAYEFNGNFMAWAPGNSSSPTAQADFVKAWQHVADLVHHEGAVDGITVKTVWNPTDINWTAYNVTKLYPGDSHVDIIATDQYSPVYPLDLANWATGGTSQASDLTTWAANAANRAHFWQYANASQWNPHGSPGVGLSFQQTVNFAKAHNKPLALGETGAGGNGTTTGPVDDAAFPKWLSGALQKAQSQGVKIAFVNIWDAQEGDGNWQFSGAGATKPHEAAAWKQYFGTGSGTASAASVSTAAVGGGSAPINSAATTVAQAVPVAGTSTSAPVVTGQGHSGPYAVDLTSATHDENSFQLSGASAAVRLGDGTQSLRFHDLQCLQLVTGSGDDKVLADAGKDTFTIGSGNAIIGGGSGDDTYIFANDSGNLTIKDFVSGKDSLNVAADLRGALTEKTTATGVVLNFGSGHSIALAGLASFDAGNIHWH